MSAAAIWQLSIQSPEEWDDEWTMAVSRQPGTTDVFAKQPDGLVWHGFWPRKPR